MADQIILHRRIFDKNLQKTITEDCLKNGYALQYQFEKIPIIAREIDMGKKVVEKMLPEQLWDYIEFKIDNFEYSIEFYLSMGRECPHCYP